jgi:hypothetical protein
MIVKSLTGTMAGNFTGRTSPIVSCRLPVTRREVHLKKSASFSHFADDAGDNPLAIDSGAGR